MKVLFMLLCTSFITVIFSELLNYFRFSVLISTTVNILFNSTAEYKNS